jgi:hypothetical protein
MQKAQRAPMRVPVFLLEGREWKRGIFVFCLVTNVFSSCSPRELEVLKLFPNMFPIAPQIYPLWLAPSSTLMYVYKLKRWALYSLYLGQSIWDKSEVPLGTLCFEP